MHTPISKVYRIIDSLSGRRKPRELHASLALSRSTNIANIAEEFADRSKRTGVEIKPKIPGFCSASFRSKCSELVVLVCASPPGHRSPTVFSDTTDL
ncbi:hypothetical protein HPB47_018413 [Ixodes persulcatus]|uniref:Uncharacterized protein n=1 Tax=Ixodes persulcatus TaxID=34615 RepID=A0AC60QKS4_IXOPE|nr:hypothetical protein HPB47_018413 [Ixodes persulcatus]